MRTTISFIMYDFVMVAMRSLAIEINW